MSEAIPVADLEKLDKQEDKTKRSKSGDIVIESVGDLDFNFNILIFAEYGTGKTVLSGSASVVDDMSPVLILDIEGGTLSLKETYPDVKVIRIKSWDDFITVSNSIAKGKPPYNEFKTVIVDSLTELQKLSMYAIMGKLVDEKEDRDPDVAGLREYSKNTEQIRKVVRKYRDLPINTIFTALSNSDRDEKKGKIRQRISLTNKLSSEVGAFFDVVLYLYVKEVKGEFIRLLLSGQTDEISAKDRSNKLPLVIENPTMEDIYGYLSGKESKREEK